MWLKFIGWMGRLVNLAGVPGLVRECQYTSQTNPVRVVVRRTALYTIITVNGVDVYFYRLTGGIDGVGMSQSEPVDK